VGSIDFELNTSPFLGLHPIFNVDLIQPYFPPLLDTFEITKQLTPTELNPDCMEQASTDQIVDTHVKGTHQQRIQLYRVVKAGKLLHQGKWLTWGQIQQKFPHLIGELNTMEAIASYGGRIDPCGYLWSPTYSNCFLVSIFYSTRLFILLYNCEFYTSGAA
jgi:hypothetical protein